MPLKKKVITHRQEIRRVFGFYTFLFLVWGCYRLLFRLPEEVEELILKPIIWLGPVFYLVIEVERKNLSSLGFSLRNFFKSVYGGLGLGVVFALVGVLENYFWNRRLFFSFNDPKGLPFIISFLVSLATALSEETVFRGYIFLRLKEILKEEWLANFTTGILFVLIHLPVVIFVFHYGLAEMATYSLLVFLFSTGSAVIFSQTGNLISSILAHIFWGWSITLFR